MEDNRKRNMDRRRETSRYAARDRRGKEADIFQDLKDVVPIVEEGTVTHLDRIALLRVAATVCRLRKTAGNVLENELEDEKVDVWNEDTLSECLDGFVIIADSDSSILYITESVGLYLGLTQTDLTGRTLKDFFHPADYAEFIKLAGELSVAREENDCTDGVDVVFRMKTVISPRGRCLNLKSALYKPVAFLVHSKVSSGGHVLFMQGVTIPAGQGSINATANAMTKYTESPTGTFMTRHTCDMRISYVSDRFNYILKSELKSLMGTSFYELVHPADLTIVSKAMKELFNKGHVRTPYYRMVAANHTLAWVQTEATTISHTTKGQKGQYVICVHYVLGIQGESESLVVCTDAMPAGMQVNIKKEIDDTRDYVGRQPEIIECVDFTPLIGNDEVFDLESLRPDLERPEQAEKDMGTRKSSFDDVLQWLFRDHPSSPAPGFRRGDDSSSGSSPCDDPSLASIQLLDSSACGARETRQHQGYGAQNGGSSQSYSPLTEGISKCGIDSPPSDKSGHVIYRDSRPVAGVCGQADPSRRFSSVQASDALAMPSAGIVPVCPASDMFTSLSSANSHVATSSIDAANRGGVNGNIAQTPMSYEPIICDDLQWEEPDLSGLAPFVDTCDMMQVGESLPPELQVLYDLPDYTPTVPQMPAARAVHVQRPRAAASPPTKRMARGPCDDFDYRTTYQPVPQQYSADLFMYDLPADQTPWMQQPAGIPSQKTVQHEMSRFPNPYPIS